MAAPILTKKHVSAEITLMGEGATFSGGGNTKNYEGLAHDVNIEKTSYVSKNHCRCEIFGLKQDDVQRLTTVMAQQRFGVKNNKIVIRAWEDGGPKAVIYQGDIYNAMGTYHGPDTGIHIEAMTGALVSITPKEPYTVSGERSLLSIMEELAAGAGFAFQNNKVPDVQTRDVVLNGSATQKMYELSLQYDFELVIDDNKVVMNPWGLGLGAEHDVSAKTGLVGYPTITPNGIEFAHVFKTYFRQSGIVNVQSLVPYATGKWKIIKMVHRLQSEGAGRNWSTHIYGLVMDDHLAPKSAPLPAIVGR